MTHRLLYLIGAPGSGKSQLMARLTQDFDRHSIGAAEHYPVAHDVLTDRPEGKIVGVELGVRRELFSGTDALPSSIIEKAIPWVQAKPYPLILAEGARLANKRFLNAAVEAGYDLTLALLDHAEVDDWRKARSKKIGRAQNASWVKGRSTADHNLAEHFGQLTDGIHVTVLSGHPDQLVRSLQAVISADG